MVKKVALLILPISLLSMEKEIVSNDTLPPEILREVLIPAAQQSELCATLHMIKTLRSVCKNWQEVLADRKNINEIISFCSDTDGLADFERVKNESIDLMNNTILLSPAQKYLRTLLTKVQNKTLKKKLWLFQPIAFFNNYKEFYSELGNYPKGTPSLTNFKSFSFPSDSARGEYTYRVKDCWDLSLPFCPFTVPNLEELYPFKCAIELMGISDPENASEKVEEYYDQEYDQRLTLLANGDRSALYDKLFWKIFKSVSKENLLLDLSFSENNMRKWVPFIHKYDPADDRNESKKNLLFLWYVIRFQTNRAKDGLFAAFCITKKVKADLYGDIGFLKLLLEEVAIKVPSGELSEDFIQEILNFVEFKKPEDRRLLYWLLFTDSKILFTTCLKQFKNLELLFSGQCDLLTIVRERDLTDDDLRKQNTILNRLTVWFAGKDIDFYKIVLRVAAYMGRLQTIVLLLDETHTEEFLFELIAIALRRDHRDIVTYLSERSIKETVIKIKIGTDYSKESYDENSSFDYSTHLFGGYGKRYRQ